MSRPHLNENLNAVQMFPFVAVLLCTMGSLLVLLVAVARSSRDQAIEQVVAEKTATQATVAAVDAEMPRKLEHAQKYTAHLAGVRTRAEQQLRQDQLRLSHVEDHIRRLHDELTVLQLAAVELNSKEGAHYDDRAQAERELERLEQLIAEARDNIEQLRGETRGKRKSVAILPTEGPKGTRRPPIYLECTKEGVLIQPEGILFTQLDFMGPPGPSSPLAAALRAAREHLVMQNPPEVAGEEVEPYALLVVRPGGQTFFQVACEVIHLSGLDFGYELVDGSWDLKYPTPDPRLATVEYQAIEIARENMRRMAEAAPRMYEGGAWAGSGGEGYVGDGYNEAGPGAPGGRFAGGGGGAPGGRGGYLVVARRVKREGGDDGYNGEGDSYGDGEGEPGQEPGGSIAGGSNAGGSNAGGSNAGGSNAGGSNAGGSSATGSSAGSPAIAKPGQPQSPQQKVRFGATADPGNAAAAGANGEQPDDATSHEYLAGQMQDRRRPPMPSRNVDDDEQIERFEPHGKDWAIKRMPNTVPIRRTIRVVVRGDRLAILPDRPDGDSTGREVVLRGSTDAAVGRFVRELQDHIADWGIAGQGLAWRPVLELKVAPDGQRRANDLVRLLEDSGIEVRTAVAQHDSGDPSRASR